MAQQVKASDMVEGRRYYVQPHRFVRFGDSIWLDSSYVVYTEPVTDAIPVKRTKRGVEFEKKKYHDNISRNVSAMHIAKSNSGLLPLYGY